MRVWIIAARDCNNGIAKSGNIPWTCSADMKHFSAITRGTGNNAVLMGRATWETIGHPLPGRLNLVMTRQVEQAQENEDGAYLVPNFNSAHQLCLERDVDMLWVCGGAQIYKQVLDDHIELVERCILTTIEGTWDCDTFFPELCAKTWTLQSSFPLGDECTTVNIYDKLPPKPQLK